MLEKKRIRIIQILWLGTLAACQTTDVKTENLHEASAPTKPPIEAVLDANVNSPSSAPDQANALKPDNASAYKDAINLASSAVTLGQQATSLDDWDLIVGRWEQAIQKLQEVPTDAPDYATAQTKLKDYERNLAQSKQRLAKLKQPPAEIAVTRSAPITNGTSVATANTLTNGVERVPVIQRRGGTPVIEVTFNGKRYPMILDTGASHTHITRAMANELGIQVVGQASVATASNSQAVVDVGYIESMRVGNITRSNLPVSIGDAVPIGLLGNDFYKDFDVILQVNSVEFRPR